MNNTNTTRVESTTLTRREARNIERKTGTRPIAVIEIVKDEAPSSNFVNTTSDVWDTSRIEKNELKELLSVVPAEVTKSNTVIALAPERGMTIRAAKPRKLVAKRRMINGVMGVGAITAIALSTFMMPGLGATNATQASLLSEVPGTVEDQAIAAAEEQAAFESIVADAVANASPAVAAPETVVDRTGINYSSATTSSAIEAVPTQEPTPEQSNGDSSDVVSNTSSSGNSNSSSNSNSGNSSSNTSRNSSAAPGQTVVGANVIETASQFIGVTPYIFGGSSPSGFDCSGLVKYVYGLHGISLPHSVSGQAAAGTRVTDPQPGDLVIFPNFHVGIYAGNGKMIDAPTEGRKVELGGLDAGSSYYFVRL